MGDNTKSLIITPKNNNLPVLSFRPDAVERARNLIANARAANTRRAYASSWGFFEGWCAEERIDPHAAQPEQVVMYLEWRLSEGLLPSSLTREYSALAFYLRSSTREGAEVWRRRQRPHAISELLAGAKRTLGRPAKKKRAIVEETLLAAAQAPTGAWGEGLRAFRNRALFLVGFHGGFRRSELVGLDRDDLSSEPQGAVIVVRRSKTDQTGQGLVKAIHRDEDLGVCPVKALSDWVKGARITSGPLFRSMRGNIVTGERLDERIVADVVKRIAVYLGLKPDAFAGHSLRSGFITVAHNNGSPVAEIMVQTGHKKVEQVIDYIQRIDPFRGNAGARIRASKLREKS
jgi:integrase